MIFVRIVFSLMCIAAFAFAVWLIMNLGPNPFL